MIDINLTVIGDGACSTTRTYLTYLRAAGLRPQRLWLVNFYPASKRTAAARRWLGTRVANRLHARGKPTSSSPSPEFQSLCMALMASAPRHVELFGDFDYGAHAASVDRFTAEDYDDPYLHQRILEASDTAFLYTNGGIVPAGLLDRREIKMFHIHPGVVPNVRGSDCFLWSCLVR